MIKPTDYIVSNSLLERCIAELPFVDFKLTINQPTGKFFYDPWEIKPEYKNTVWEKVLNCIPYSKGEARIIKLDSGTCYTSHADIDDRWHLSLTGNKCYMIDLDANVMHPISADGVWYDMNAGNHHSAATFGEVDRYQIVVRQLLTNGNLKNPKKVLITPTTQHKARYNFDERFSPWLNRANKKSILRNFTIEDLDLTIASFETEHIVANELSMIGGKEFSVEITDI